MISVMTQDVVQLESENSSLPEPEQAPSTPTVSEGAAMLPEQRSDLNSLSQPGEADPLTTPIPDALPGELSGEETVIFGDVVVSNCEGGGF